MKLLTTNFLTCAIKTCKSTPASYPLHFRDAELLQNETEFQPSFLRNIIPRLDWAAFTTTANELGLSTFVPASKPEGDDLDDEAVLKGLHRVLVETEVIEGKLVCGNCGHEYRVKEGIANFLLPSHLV